MVAPGGRCADRDRGATSEWRGDRGSGRGDRAGPACPPLEKTPRRAANDDEGVRGELLPVMLLP